MEALLELCEHKEIVVLSDLINTTGTKQFAQHRPLKHFVCPVHNALLGIATGLALEGKIPVVATKAENIEKNITQLKKICSEKLNIKILGMGNETINVQGLTIIIPVDANETKKAVIAAVLNKGPVYLQVSKEENKITDENAPFILGRAEILRKGEDATIIAAGKELKQALEAAAKLAEQEIECTVINNHTIPIDKHTIMASTKITKNAVVAPALFKETAETLSQHSPTKLQQAKTSLEIIKAVKENLTYKCQNSVETRITEHTFNLSDGNKLNSIIQLQKALLEMKQETFNQHVNSEKNDFAKWVEEVFDEKKLAEEMMKMKTKLGMAARMARWLK